MIYAPTELAIGLALDLSLGDPSWLPHPIRALGWWCMRAESLWRRVPVSPRAAGVFFWCCVVLPAAALVHATLQFLPRPWIAIYWIYSLLAIRSLDHETNRAVEALARQDLPAARHWISRVVGRDTADLDEPGVLRAAIETVAENLCDAVVAPLFYLALAGPAGMAAYKAINTLDSMVGYRNERYRDFGWFSARVDDWANWIPARLSAALVWTSALLPGFSPSQAVRITFRDAARQPSPNSGWPEAAVAGALGVQLGGVNYYRSVASTKEFLGDPLQPLTVAAFRRTRVLLYASSTLMALLVWSVAR